MLEFTIKDYIDAGYTFYFTVNLIGRYEGMLIGYGERVYLSPSDLKELKKYANIHRLLKGTPFIKISGREGHYILQMLDIQLEGPNAENGYYRLEDIESDSDLLSLLEKYDEMKKEANVNKRI